MPAAGLNVADIRYIFLGHMHAGHTGGANVIQRLAPEATVVMGAPDAAIVDQAGAECQRATHHRLQNTTWLAF